MGKSMNKITRLRLTCMTNFRILKLNIKSSHLYFHFLPMVISVALKDKVPDKLRLDKSILVIVNVPSPSKTSYWLLSS